MTISSETLKKQGEFNNRKIESLLQSIDHFEKENDLLLNFTRDKIAKNSSQGCSSYPDCWLENPLQPENNFERENEFPIEFSDRLAKNSPQGCSSYPDCWLENLIVHGHLPITSQYKVWKTRQTMTS